MSNETYLSASPDNKIVLQALYIYFPIISHSILTASPIFLEARFVLENVNGIIDTENPLSTQEKAVKLIPSTATEPFSMMYGVYSTGYSKRKII